jgi:hypothetical protein
MERETFSVNPFFFNTSADCTCFGPPCCKVLGLEQLPEHLIFLSHSTTELALSSTNTLKWKLQVTKGFSNPYDPIIHIPAIRNQQFVYWKTSVEIDMHAT